MKRFLFIGMDFSKRKFEVAVLEGIEQKRFAQAVFENSEQSYELMRWMPRQSKIERKNQRFCGGQTGMCRIFLQEKECMYG